VDRVMDRVRDRDMSRVTDRVRLRGLAIADPNCMRITFSTISCQMVAVAWAGMYNGRGVNKRGAAVI